MHIKSYPLTMPAIALGLLLSPLAGFAVDGTWNISATGNWSDTAKWNSGTIANGTDAIANFNVLTNQAITLDTDITVGRLNFTNSSGNTLSSGNGSVLTLATSSGGPVIDGTATISAILAGTQGFSFGPGGFRDLTLSGNNTYTGATSVSNGGILFIRSNNALGASGAGNGTSVTYQDNARAGLHFNSSSGSLNVAEEITLRITASGNGSATPVGSNLIQNVSASNSTTLTGDIVLTRASTTTNGRAATNLFGIQSAGTLNIEGDIIGASTVGASTSVNADPTRVQFRTTTATASVDVSGDISDGTVGAGGLSVYTSDNSSGIVRLSGNNTYTGSTVHQTGTMLINNTVGSGTGTGSVSVVTGAIFGGNGIIKPTGTNGVLFSSGAVVAPGDLSSSGSSIAAGEALTFDLSGTTGSVVFSSGATVSFNLFAAAETPAEVSERLAFIGLSNEVGQIAFNDNVVNFSVTAGLLSDGLYTIASFDANNAYSGGLIIGTGLEDYDVKQLIFNANSIQLAIGNVIPEPATGSLLAGLAAIGFGLSRRRRRQA